MKIMVLFVTRNELQWIRVSLYFLEGSLVSYKAPSSSSPVMMLVNMEACLGVRNTEWYS